MAKQRISDRHDAYPLCAGGGVGGGTRALGLSGDCWDTVGRSPVYVFPVISKYIISGGPLNSLYCLSWKHHFSLQTSRLFARTLANLPSYFSSWQAQRLSFEQPFYQANISLYTEPLHFAQTPTSWHPSSPLVHINPLLSSPNVSRSHPQFSRVHKPPHLHTEPLFPHTPCSLYFHLPAGWREWESSVSCKPDIFQKTLSQDSQC